VFSRREYAPSWAEDRLEVIPPSIDPFSPKNTQLSPDDVAAVLARVGFVDGLGPQRPVQFQRRDGSTGRVRPRRTGIVLDGPAPPAGVPLVVQVSRWDHLKDMAGVMTGFAEMLRHDLPARPHLMLLGPDVDGVTDDPEGADVLATCRQQRQQLPGRIRDRIHLAAVPMDDLDENALIVNAVQRYADVVVQKSLVEGFGLTVTEAMWKERPVLASRVGGIQDQIRPERDGLLLDDPTDPVAFARMLRRVLEDHRLAARLGVAARARVLDQYVGDRHLEQYADVLSRLSA
jgi:trehalose synthase